MDSERLWGDPLSFGLDSTTSSSPGPSCSENQIVWKRWWLEDLTFVVRGRIYLFGVWEYVNYVRQKDWVLGWTGLTVVEENYDKLYFLVVWHRVCREVTNLSLHGVPCLLQTTIRVLSKGLCLGSTLGLLRPPNVLDVSKALREDLPYFRLPFFRYLYPFQSLQAVFRLLSGSFKILSETLRMTEIWGKLGLRHPLVTYQSHRKHPVRVPLWSTFEVLNLPKLTYLRWVEYVHRWFGRELVLLPRFFLRFDFRFLFRLDNHRRNQLFLWLKQSPIPTPVPSPGHSGPKLPVCSDLSLVTPSTFVFRVTFLLISLSLFLLLSSGLRPWNKSDSRYSTTQDFDLWLEQPEFLILLTLSGPR